ncbi:transcriptional regulator [Weissella oryzae SG25]|uniref:Transcriptional regulator n=1 Tax=Weissella oryzae (strain DSM 25784 / JCM 18191 / LMG 30913 / SG25) TaxID=1329250 RepID=A0A069CX66_WEIOS|nr:transcriptional regulator [Weissella oryzae SG25]
MTELQTHLMIISYYTLYSIVKDDGIAMQLSSELMDGLVLALLDKDNLYGYALTKQVQAHFAVSESTMYPVLRRLKARGLVTTYDEPFEGRNRRYYQISAQGRAELATIQADWQMFSAQINAVITEGVNADGE